MRSSQANATKVEGEGIELIETLMPIRRVPVSAVNRNFDGTLDISVAYYFVPKELPFTAQDPKNEICCLLPNSEWGDRVSEPIWEDGELHPSVGGYSNIPLDARGDSKTA